MRTAAVTFLNGQNWEPEGAFHLHKCLQRNTQPRRSSAASERKSNSNQFNIKWSLCVHEIERRYRGL